MGGFNTLSSHHEWVIVYIVLTIFWFLMLHYRYCTQMCSYFVCISYLQIQIDIISCRLLIPVFVVNELFTLPNDEIISNLWNGNNLSFIVYDNYVVGLQIKTNHQWLGHVRFAQYFRQFIHFNPSSVLLFEICCVIQWLIDHVAYHK